MEVCSEPAIASFMLHFAVYLPVPTSLGFPMLPCARDSIRAARQPGDHGANFRLR